MIQQGAETHPLHAGLQRLVVICPSWVGDNVMATPTFARLRAALPETSIIAIVRPGLKPLFSGNSWFDVLEEGSAKGPFGPVRVAAIIRDHKPDAVFLLPNSFASAFAAKLGGAPIRVGYDRDGRRPLLTHGISSSNGKLPCSTIHHYAKLTDFALGTSDSLLPMTMTKCDDDERIADSQLKNVSGRFVVLIPGANKQAKRWPARSFAQTGDVLAQSDGLDIVVTGGPKEGDVVHAVCAAAQTTFHNLFGNGMTLGSLKSVIARASLVITNDTGPRHIAIAMKTPVVSLFGPTDHRWTDIDGASELQLLAYPFLPQEFIADRCAKVCSIERVPTADVVAAARSLLGDHGETAASMPQAAPEATPTSQ